MTRFIVRRQDIQYFSMKSKPKFRFHSSWIQDDVEGSSNIKRIAFDQEKGHLYVEFTRGGIYRYDPYTLKKYEVLKNSPSVGAHFQKTVVKNKDIIFKQM